ncbi:DUF998 domain-containing protein [Ilumatobacter sp.]|uniref:DUF998 domain-containing protein n=1 Tax=Ilumatobacter sp. TaxID=1967498 RepID=UPI003B529082
MRRRTRRGAAWGGVVGPIAFVTAWAVAAAVTSAPYSSVDDAISRLAAVGSDVRSTMTVGFVAFSAGVGPYAIALRRAVPGRAWWAALATAGATIAVAALPLDRSDLVDRLHAAAAVVGYVTLVGVPLGCARPLARLGHRTLAAAAIVATATSTVGLAASLVVDADGLAQRIGLSATDAWIVASVPTVRALAAARRPTLDGDPPHGIMDR